MARNSGSDKVPGAEDHSSSSAAQCAQGQALPASGSPKPEQRFAMRQRVSAKGAVLQFGTRGIDSDILEAQEG